jgi:hypothetical protein
MNKKISLLFALSFVIINSTIVISQSRTEPSFNSLRTPTSPAFVLLGVEPVAVERPNSPSSLAFSLVNNAGDFKTLSNNFAVEFSPYWLIARPMLTWREDISRSLLESISRTLTLSAAVADIGTEVFPAKGLSGAMRTSIISGTMSDESIRSLELLEKQLGTEASIFSRFVERYRKIIDEDYLHDLKLYEDDPIKLKDLTERYNEVIQFIGESVLIEEEYLDSIAAARQKVEEFAVFREGFSLDFALGGLWDFENGVFDNHRFNRLGMWLSPGYTSSSFSIAGLIRYFYYENFDDVIDFGGRLIFSEAKYSISGEVAGRSFSGDQSRDAEIRAALTLEYEVHPSIWVTAVFGKDFNSDSEGSLIATAGINFNFNSERYFLK